MDGVVIAVGDIVYDILLGAGTVAKLNRDGSYVVAFTGRQMTYQPGGMFMGLRRLYWGNPIVFIPKKGEERKMSIIKQTVELLVREL